MRNDVGADTRRNQKWQGKLCPLGNNRGNNLSKDPEVGLALTSSIWNRKKVGVKSSLRGR